MKRLLSHILLLNLAAFCITGCGSKEPAYLGQLLKPGQAKGFNVLLVTLDSATQVRLGCYGYQLAVTPTIDSLAADGVQYYDAVTSVALTLPSNNSIMTGQISQRHGVRDNGLAAPGPESSTLAEDLRQAGYGTATFVGAFTLDKRFGLDRGFDSFDFQVRASEDRPPMTDLDERPTIEVTDSTLDWLNQHRSINPDQPFFVWIRYFSADISFVDGQLKRLVDWLDESGTRENTVIILTANPGESQGEHQGTSHGMNVDNSTMKVPLIFNCPSRIFGHLAVKNSTVGLVDLRATISEMIGIQPSAPTDGQSLLQSVASDRNIYLETDTP